MAEGLLQTTSSATSNSLTTTISPITAFLATVFVGAVVLRYKQGSNPKPRFPPGPSKLFLLRHSTQPRGAMIQLCRDLRQRYGDVFSIALGSRKVVLFNGYDVMKEAFVTQGDVFCHRPPDFAGGVFEGKGIVGSSGELWREQKLVARNILRRLGMGGHTMQVIVQEEIPHVFAAIDAQSGAFNPRRLLEMYASNVVCALLFGKRFDYEDEKFKEAMIMQEANFLNVGKAMLEKSNWCSSFFSVLMKLLRRKSPSPPAFTSFVLQKLIQPAISQRIQDLAGSGQEEEEEEEEGENGHGKLKDFISAYLKEMRLRQKSDEPTTLDESNLARSAADIFGAGTETTASVLCWALLYLVNYPHIQARCQEEVREAVGASRFPTMEDKAKTPYTEAFCWEVVRHNNVTPFVAEYAPTRDVTFRGHALPAGTPVWPVLDSIAMDPSVWGDPEVFRPDRFLNKDGQVARPEQFIPFGVGRRHCLGESLAKAEIYLFVAAILQRYDVTAPEGTQPPLSMEGMLGLLWSPLPYDICFKHSNTA